ncbi:D-beta-hydroxybutyrate dehydrogenase [bacterium HR32]|jgi:3-hydroxybutyrate dehydrogenase|nr:D-beta-hydroxybutyrate dehydrogenase [bacterium HR32]
MAGLEVSVQGRVAVVTGAGSGIGRAVAHALSRAGAAVCAADLDADAAGRVASELEREGGRAVAVAVDVQDPRAVRAMVSRTVESLGALDILVNNAGLQFISPVHEFPEERWDRLVGVMLTGTFLCTKYALPHMMARGWGRVVNMASIHGLVASPYKSAYVAAKHGVVGFTKTVALEVGGYGITVNAICPAYVRTPLVEGQIADQARVHGISEEEVVRRIMLEPAAIKRLLEPEEVANLVVYLCSDLAAGITGAAYTVDAGWTAR